MSIMICPVCNKETPFHRNTKRYCSEECCSAAYRAKPGVMEGKRAYNREWAKKRAEYRRSYRLKLNFGMSVEEYDAMLLRQDGRCAICGDLPDVLKKPLCVDHDHATNKIRGLLCQRCNTGVGQLQDSVDNLKAAIKYLERQVA